MGTISATCTIYTDSTQINVLYSSKNSLRKMERWVGRVAVVTGASSGIGAAVTEQLAKHGLNVVGIARRKERVEEIAKKLQDEKGKVFAVKANITEDEEVVEAFDWIQKNVGGVDILINNAGVLVKTNIEDGEVENWKKMYELNVFSIGSCTREALKSMKSRNVDDGHIINVNSIGGQRLSPRKGSYIYSSTKFAAKIVTEGLRLELAERKSKIKVTNVSPGLVKTEFFDAGIAAGEMSDLFVTLPHLKPEEVADAIVYAISTPPGVQIAELTVRPTSDSL